MENVALEEPTLKISSEGRHEEIFVEKINGILWNKFVDTLYRKSRPTPILGKKISYQLIFLNSLADKKDCIIKLVYFQESYILKIVRQ